MNNQRARHKRNLYEKYLVTFVWRVIVLNFIIISFNAYNFICKWMSCEALAQLSYGDAVFFHGNFGNQLTDIYIYITIT